MPAPIKRRKILKGLGIGVPAAWVAPVVHTTLLPVHAQTSGVENDDEDDGAGCPELTIPGAFNSCELLLDTPFLTYYIDDTGDCPAVEPGAAPSSEVSTIFIAPGVSGGNPLVDLIIDEPLGSSFILQNCNAPLSDDSFLVELDIVALSGATWILEFTVTREATSVTLGTITVRPQ